MAVVREISLTEDETPRDYRRLSSEEHVRNKRKFVTVRRTCLLTLYKKNVDLQYTTS